MNLPSLEKLISSKMALQFIVLLLFFIHARISSVEGFQRLTRQEAEELQETCGKTEKNAKLRIAFGNRALPGQFPWAARLHPRLSGCSASVISKYHIMTAAHCFFGEIGFTNINFSDIASGNYGWGGSVCIKPVIGEEHIAAIHDCSDEETKQVIRLSFKSMIIPSDAVNFFAYARMLAAVLFIFGKENFVKTCESLGRCSSDSECCNMYLTRLLVWNLCDIAILELREPITNLFNGSIRPICIPDPRSSLPERFQVYGFGDTDIGQEQLNNRLHWMAKSTEILNYENCISKYEKETCKRVIIEVGKPHDNTTICHGDSGGGLSGILNGKHYLFGVSSHAWDYCHGPIREVYRSQISRISYKHDFICYYTGICPMGYNKFLDSMYPMHPEKVIYVSDGKGPSELGIDDVIVPNDEYDKLRSDEPSKKKKKTKNLITNRMYKMK